MTIIYFKQLQGNVNNQRKAYYSESSMWIILKLFMVAVLLQWIYRILMKIALSNNITVYALCR